MGKKSKRQQMDEMVSRDKRIIHSIWNHTKELVIHPRFFGPKLKADVVEYYTVIYEYLLMAFVNWELSMKDRGIPIPQNLKEHNVKDRIAGRGADVDAAYCACKNCELRSEKPAEDGWYKCTVRYWKLDNGYEQVSVGDHEGCSEGIPRDMHK